MIEKYTIKNINKVFSFDDIQNNSNINNRCSNIFYEQKAII